jgi:putative nucleotidyltransferase with HDIG domain
MADHFARPQAPWALRLLPPFPTVAQRVLALTNLEYVSLRDLGDLIRMDSSFSAELLRFVNSPLFGMRGQVTSLSQALLLSGLDRVKTMAAMIAIRRMVRVPIRVAALRKVWLHTLATAVIAEEAARVAGVPTEPAYAAGLLHNLGGLGLMSAYPAEYSRMLAVSDDFGFDLLQTERDLFDIDHCAAGAYLAQDWDFPDELAAVIATHHDAPVAGEAGLFNLVAVGWRMSDALGFAAFSPQKCWNWQELIALLPKSGASSWLAESAEVAQAEVRERVAALPV